MAEARCSDSVFLNWLNTQNIFNSFQLAKHKGRNSNSEANLKMY